MELAEAITEVRSILDDNVVPPQFSDEDITRQLNAAVDEAAIRTRVIQDPTSPAARIALRVGVSRYRVNAAVYAIRRIRIDGVRDPLHLFDTVMMDREFPGWDDPTLAATGTPTHAVFDYETQFVQFYPVPTVVGTARLLVWRTALETEKLDHNDPTGEPAIPPLMHRELKHWAAAQCYLNSDSETRSPKLAAEQFGLFEAAYGRKPDLHEIRLWSTNKRRHVRACFD